MHSPAACSQAILALQTFLGSQAVATEKGLKVTCAPSWLKQLNQILPQSLVSVK